VSLRTLCFLQSGSAHPRTSVAAARLHARESIVHCSSSSCHIFAPLYFILIFIKRVQLRLLPTHHVFFFASVSTSGKSSIHSGVSARMSRSFERAPKGCLPISNSSSPTWLKSCGCNLSVPYRVQMLTCHETHLVQDRPTDQLMVHIFFDNDLSNSTHAQRPRRRSDCHR
jgi:hypothetical protein